MTSTMLERQVPPTEAEGTLSIKPGSSNPSLDGCSPLREDTGQQAFDHTANGRIEPGQL